MQMQLSMDEKWYHGRSSHDGYVVVAAELVEQRYHTWLSEHPHATSEMKQHLENLIFSADLWDTYAQIESGIIILEVYGIVEEQENNCWHLCSRFWGKTRTDEIIDEKSLKAWLTHFQAQQFLQSDTHPLSGVYTLPQEKR